MHSKCRQLTFVSTKTVPVVIFRLFIYFIRRVFYSPLFRYALNNTSCWLTVFTIFPVVTTGVPRHAQPVNAPPGHLCGGF